MVVLRALTTEDWPLWRAVRRAVLAEAPHAFKTRLADWHRGGEERWRARLEMPGAHHVVALLDGRAVGMASEVPADGGTRELRSVWVGPEVRGRGVGDRLLTAVETWARQSDAAAVQLVVIPGNDHAAALCRRHGFVAAAELGDLLPDGVTREHVMTKALR